MKSGKILKQLAKLAILMLTGSGIYADDMQKVIILPFQNIDKNPNYEYLESTLTDAIREKLKTRFAFSETPEREWKSLAKKNFLYENECYTATYAMNIGLLSTQDVVINGGFTVEKSKSDQDSDIIKTKLRLVSITEKRIISELDIDVPANNQLFQTIDQVADTAAAEASKVLPNKDDWEKNRKKKKVAKKIFSNMDIGIRAGANFYLDGFADQFATKLPALTVLMRANMPIIANKLFVQIEYTYYQHELAKGAQNYFVANNLSLLATNNAIGAFAGYDFMLSDIFRLSPRIGGGAIFQNTQVSGAISQNVNNTIPYIGVGLDFAWLATDNLKVVVDAGFNAQIEDFSSQGKTVITYIPTILAGINMGF